MLSVILAMTLLCGCIYLSVPKIASAKVVSKVTKTITITNKKKGAVWHTLSIKKGEKVKVKVKFLEVQGKPVDKYFQGENTVMYSFGGNIDPSGAYEDFFFTDDQKSPKAKLKKDSFKKGNVLISSYGLNRNMLKDVYWQPLKGISKIKLKVTYFTVSGKAGINSVKTQRKNVYDPGWK